MATPVPISAESAGISRWGWITLLLHYLINLLDGFTTNNRPYGCDNPSRIDPSIPRRIDYLRRKEGG
jgi:hypothetical protein